MGKSGKSTISISSWLPVVANCNSHYQAGYIKTYAEIIPSRGSTIQDSWESLGAHPLVNPDVEYMNGMNGSPRIPQ